MQDGLSALVWFLIGRRVNVDYRRDGFRLHRVEIVYWRSWVGPMKRAKGTFPTMEEAVQFGIDILDSWDD